MERLTRKSDTSDMVWFIDREHKSGYAEREPCDMDAHHARLAIAKLAEYEDLEEQGKLLKLPCAPGQSVWKIKNGKISKCVVSIIKTDESGVWFCNAAYICDICDFGETVFLTQEEAEAALKELEAKEV